MQEIIECADLHLRCFCLPSDIRYSNH